MKNTKIISLHRYTNLAATIHMLRTKSITLLNPATWDDRNDSYFMAQFKRLNRLKSILALCFADGRETYHHWRVFSHGSDGVRIEFDREALLSAFANDARITARPVEYKKIQELKDADFIEMKALPFLKRDAFRDEVEFRIIFADENEAIEYKDYLITLNCIRRITLSPWMTKTLSASVRDTLRSIRGCEKIQVSRSTLVDNERWQSLASNAR